MYQNSLIKKIRLVSNFMASQPGYQTVVIHIFPNISKSKGNQSGTELWSVNRMQDEKHFS